jgi:hypothetical protein
MTIPEIVAIDRAFDVTLTRRLSNRWSLQTNFIYNWDRDRGFVQNPNEERFNDRTITTWAWKLNGTWLAPYGLEITPAVRHQSGDPLARVVSVSLRVGTLSYEAEEPGAYREDNIWIFDTKVGKRFSLGSARSARVFVDLFNITNSNAAQTQDNIVGRRTTTVDGASVNYQRFLRPTSILAPRVLRFGIRLAL